MSNESQGVLITFVVIYLAPAINAWSRGHRSAAAITALNVLLGWTLLGWIASCVWSYTANTWKNTERQATLMTKAVVEVIAQAKGDQRLAEAPALLGLPSGEGSTHG